MVVHGRSFLLGLGLFGMVIGACLGLVVGKLNDECTLAKRVSDADAGAVLGPMCERVANLRVAAFGLVAMSAIGALLPVAQDKLAARKAT